MFDKFRRVDHDRKIIHGAVACEVGEFRSGRGQFDRESLQAIVKLINARPAGIPVCYGHQPDPGSATALDSFLGRSKNARLDRNRVLVDLYFSEIAFDSLTGRTSRGEQIFRRAESDPGSFGLSLVLTADKLPQPGAPPIWRPAEISSLDLVYVADAVHGGLLPALSVPLAGNVVLTRETHFAEALAFIPR